MSPEISSAISAINASIGEAERYLDICNFGYNDEGDFESFKHYIERAFVELLVLADSLQLKQTFQMVNERFENAKTEGFGTTVSYEGESYSKWAGPIRMYADAIASSYGFAKTTQSEITELKAVLKRAVYTICDRGLFPNLPSSEADVHRRIEAILRCKYSDLKSKPALAKPIKNFEPDTGLPSAKTLIEYKFISSDTEAKRVADEILADASGYRSRDWHSLLFVIYETRRVKPEEEWQQLLRACELHEGYDAIVLSGEARGAA
jgi:hypothetical protein